MTTTRALSDNQIWSVYSHVFASDGYGADERADIIKTVRKMLAARTDEDAAMLIEWWGYAEERDEIIKLHEQWTAKRFAVYVRDAQRVRALAAAMRQVTSSVAASDANDPEAICDDG